MAQISASSVSRWIHEGKLVLHFLFDFLILKRSILVGHGRWQRNRTGRPLSPLQIHRKNIWTLSKLHKTTDREQKDIITQVQESQRVPNRINPRRNTPRHILIKLTKIKHKEKILKSAREKQQITHKGILIRITADLSIEAFQARRKWQDILKVMKENNLEPRLLYPARISFRYEGEFRSFTDKQKLREFSTTKPALQQMLKDLL